jgi:drug/metabolite transporter (DMT)-like permease
MRRGVLFLILAMTLTPAADGAAKALSTDYAPMTLACLRYLSAGLVALVAAAALRRPIVVPAADRLGLVLRTALIMAAMTALIAALGATSMARAVGGFLIAPIVSGLLGVVVWGERPTAARVVGSALALAGAAALARPEAGLEAGCLYALAGGALLGVYLAATRGARDGADPLSTLAVQSLLGAAMLAPFALVQGVPDLSARLLWGAPTLGAISAACHFLTVAAYQRAEASVLAPFMYFNMITAVVAGYVLFGEVPTGASALGLAAIAGGGLVTLSRLDWPRIPALAASRSRFA